MKQTVSSITSFDSDSGILMSTGHLLVTWRDELHTWLPRDFGGVLKISVTDKQIWMPELRQLAHTNDQFEISTAWLYSNGTVYLLLGGACVAFCDLNNYHWPLDQQICVSTIAIMNADSREIELSPLTDQVDLSDFKDHGSWELVQPKANIILAGDKDLNIKLVAHQLSLTLKRRSDVIMLHSAVPIFLTSLLNTMVYFVPVRSGERISFAVTILLTFVFFTAAVEDELPKTALTTPFISIVMAIMNCMCTFNVLVSVVFSRLSSECIAPVPSKLRKFIKRVYTMKINHMLGVGRVKPHNNRSDLAKRPISHPPDKSEGPDIKEVDNEDNINNDKDAINANKTKVYDFEITWATVVDIFDLIIFIVLLCVVILVGITVVILLHGIGA